MIYTVTINPAVDYTIKIPELVLGKVNRSEKEEYFFGGKGVNVSIVLHNLGIKSIALGFIAGFTGQFVRQGIYSLGIKNDFIDLPSGMTRINVKIKADKETDINAVGPVIPKDSIELLCKKIEKVKDNDFLVLAGAVPNNVDEQIYSDLLSHLKAKNVHVIIDATRNYLINALKHKPFLVKPNRAELGQLFNKEIHTDADIVLYAKKLQEMGARNVLVSIGDKGAVLVTENDDVICNDAPKGITKNTVGAGDSLTAGFIAGYMEKKDFRYALKYGLASGSATAFSDTLASKNEIEQILKTIE
ncbi:MAG: 1-phosphofructokinase [Clostridia bacterium]|nr:1-phosphofructokinase [Clostridia bacterium]